MENLVYWDLYANAKRTAKHNTADEVQYGDDPKDRGPASQFLIEVITDTPHEQRRMDRIIDQPLVLDRKPDTPSTKPQSMETTQCILQDNPPPYTASAAKTVTGYIKVVQDTIE